MVIMLKERLIFGFKNFVMALVKIFIVNIDVDWSCINFYALVEDIEKIYTNSSLLFVQHFLKN